jgi:hypothetical protein
MVAAEQVAVRYKDGEIGRPEALFSSCVLTRTRPANAASVEIHPCRRTRHRAGDRHRSYRIAPGMVPEGLRSGDDRAACTWARPESAPDSGAGKRVMNITPGIGDARAVQGGAY